MRRNTYSQTISLSPEEIEREYKRIQRALLNNIDDVLKEVQKKFQSPKPWKFSHSDHKLSDTGEVIDLVFEHSDPEDKRFVVVDICVPYLGRGQKYTLDGKARIFQKEQGVAATRVKKALLMLKREGETLAPPPAKLSGKIIEMQIPVIAEKKEQPQQPAIEKPLQKAESELLTPQLLDALERTIVYECLATMYKRRNKYIRKGLWRWIEREIMDPNVHFFLVMLSAIYQGKTSDVLSRQFKNLRDYTENSEKVIEALFSSETALAPEILKNVERHKQAMRKFLACFSQTPPFEYLRTLFLKEFRTTRDGLRARIAVFDTLKELLLRCGFEGEKEVQYPLEILDELSIFPGFITGNYSQLRVENASKKLQKLVPNHIWNAAEIYKLRDELAKKLGLPPEEFNLNAFLPQAFLRDSISNQTGYAVQNTSFAHNGSSNIQAKPFSKRENVQQAVSQKPSENDSNTAAALPFQIVDGGSANADSVPQVTELLADNTKHQRPQRPQRSRYAATADLPVVTSISQEQVQSISSTNLLEDSNVMSVEADAPVVKAQPALQPAGSLQPVAASSQPGISSQHQSQPSQPPRVFNPNFNRKPDLDEARHRFFENFGGHHEEDDSEVISFVLDMERSIAELARSPKQNVPTPAEDEYEPKPPSKNGHLDGRENPRMNMSQEPKKHQNQPSSPSMQNQNANRRRHGKRRYYNNQDRRQSQRIPH